MQNSEILLDCTQVWIGSLRVKSATKLKIKSDQQAGFYFTLNSGWYLNFRIFCIVQNLCDCVKTLSGGRAHNFSIFLSSLQKCQVCRDDSLSVIFLEFTPSFAEGLRLKLGMTPTSNPTINPNSKGLSWFLTCTVRP